MSVEAMKLALEALEFSETEPHRPQYEVEASAIRALRTAIQQAEAQQPATGEPGAWNSIQIASWIGSQLMHEPSMFERAAVCKFVRSLGRHPTLLKHSPKIHPAPSVPEIDVGDVADLLYSIGWRSPCDAQWTGLKEALPKLAAMLAAKDASA